MASGKLDIGAKMLERGATGWYFRVLTPGDVSVAGPILVESRHPAAVTVFDAHSALMPGSDCGQIERVLAVEALAENWRRSLQKAAAARA